jgi:hypothetical protein
MMILTLVITMLFAGLVIGLVAGLIVLRIDRRRKKITRTLNVKDGIILEYDCSQPGINETIKAFFEGR